MFKTRYLALLLGVFGLLLVGCKNNANNENSADAHATIQLNDGSPIEFKPTMLMGGMNSPTTIRANMSDMKVTFMLVLKSSKDKPIEEGKVYENSRAQISLVNTKDKPLDETYRSYHYKSEDGEEGEAKITVTSLGEENSEGTFSGTLYSKSHKKVVVEGKFTNKKD